MWWCLLFYLRKIKILFCSGFFTLSCIQQISSNGFENILQNSGKPPKNKLANTEKNWNCSLWAISSSATMFSKVVCCRDVRKCLCEGSGSVHIYVFIIMPYDVVYYVYFRRIKIQFCSVFKPLCVILSVFIRISFLYLWQIPLN